jgi:type I restriction enzyme, R subunit
MTESEWLTRKTRIDAKLRSLSSPWEIIRFRPGLDLTALACHAVEELPTANGPADYGLIVNGMLLGIIEAKKITVNPQNVLEQAKRYSAGAYQSVGDWNGLRVPFLYATNGEIIWYLDARPDKRISRPISNFHTASALEAFFTTDLWPARQWLLDTPAERIERLRDYQLRSIVAVESAILDGRRDLLVAMATGTGKTYLTVAQIYRLLQSKFARRILFLVDRKALAAQAVREFNAFNTPTGLKFTQEYEVYSQRFQREDFGDDSPFDPKVLPNEYLTDPRPAHTFVYVATIQRMARNLFGAAGAFAQSGGDGEAEEDADNLNIPIHAFDVIIADECHRGHTAQETSIWRDTVRHFDAIRIGLTATPAAHTVGVFGEPVFRYGVEQAIRDGYLVDYEPVAIKSNVRMNGIFLKEGEHVSKVDTETGEELYDQVEDEREFPAQEVEHKITAPESNRKIIEELKKYALEHEDQTGRFPKILIFAVNDLPHTPHADQLVRICRDVFGQGDDFVQKITGNPNVDRPLQRIREFRNRPSPKIVVTVDMLSTGVDIPALEFIVFLRPVKSRILWEQMLGRGTRLCRDLNKTHFTVFDCFDGTLIRYFKDVSNFKIEEPTKEPLPLAQVIENIWQNIDRPYHIGVLVKRLRRIEKDMSGEARTEFAKWIPDGDMGKYAAKLPSLLREDFTRAMTLLRNKDFQALLLDYPRAKRSFWIAPEAHDEVSSTRLERFGKYDRAEDYLDAFPQFMKANQDKLDALAVLLRRPKDWKPEVLTELKRLLAQEDFDVPKLQKAHERAGYKPLADMISMVKHAAQEQQPVLTAEERVNAAMSKLMEAHKFTLEQKQWLSLIQEHLVTNLSIDEEDFDLTPLLQGRGGKAKAGKVFRGALAPLVAELNSALAA